MLEPVKLSPAYKDYLWGGTSLKEYYHKAGGEIIAETWELSTHPDGESVVADGTYKGLTLKEYLADCGARLLLGTESKDSQLPVLVKLIDARENLSIQVHPDDLYAEEKESSKGKTEMWVILEHEPGAALYCGVKKHVTEEEFRHAAEEGSILNLLNRVEVHRGDVFFIPAGMIHAIGKGIVLAEIQQNSNVTYRIYDYNRKDSDGHTRPLHIEKASQAAKLEPLPLNTAPEQNLCETDQMSIATLKACDFFSVYRYRIDGSVKLRVGKNSFCTFLVTEGEGTVFYEQNRSMQVRKGDTIFVPAQDTVLLLQGAMELLLIRL